MSALRYNPPKYGATDFAAKEEEFQSNGSLTGDRFTSEGTKANETKRGSMRGCIVGFGFGFGLSAILG
jgi:hypothetical protein